MLKKLSILLVEEENWLARVLVTCTSLLKSSGWRQNGLKLTFTTKSWTKCQGCQHSTFLIQFKDSKNIIKTVHILPNSKTPLPSMNNLTVILRFNTSYMNNLNLNTSKSPITAITWFLIMQKWTKTFCYSKSSVKVAKL